MSEAATVSWYSLKRTISYFEEYKQGQLTILAKSLKYTWEGVYFLVKFLKEYVREHFWKEHLQKAVSGMFLMQGFLQAQSNSNITPIHA